MIWFNIGSTRDCEMTLKLERFSHLLSRYFGLGLGIYYRYFHCLCITRKDYLEEGYLEGPE